MPEKFAVEFLPEAVRFMNSLEPRARAKIYFNIRKAQVANDPELFKKLTETIWEFRTLLQQNLLPLICFLGQHRRKAYFGIGNAWTDKENRQTPQADLEKAERIRKQYFEQKN